MRSKRKRKAHGEANRPEKRQRIAASSAVKSALLRQFYPEVLSLKEYMLSKLPTHSKVRRKKIRNLVANASCEDGFAAFLELTLVGVNHESGKSAERWQHWNAFSQKSDESVSTMANLTGLSRFSQSEIVDFSIWQIFHRQSTPTYRPSHLLCQGFRREGHAQQDSVPGAIPGVVSTYPNNHVIIMKAMPWPRVLTLWGNEGEKAMVDLILDCGIYVPVPGGREVYHQLSGIPLGELKTLAPQTQPSAKSTKNSSLRSNIRTPSEIVFVRNRMLYARAALNAQGGVRFGFRHIHILNRVVKEQESRSENCHLQSQPATANDVHLMLYIFPRQFGLHNVFTHNVDSRQTVQPFQDYTLREEEIQTKYPVTASAKVPKRLRGKTVQLIRKLRINHSRCSYMKLLDYYCPTWGRTQGTLPITPSPGYESTEWKTQASRLPATDAMMIDRSLSVKQHDAEPEPMVNHATPNSKVSAFCRAVLLKLIPHQFWGAGDVQRHNQLVFAHYVDQFIKMRRFETLSLHEVIQGVKIDGLDWLGGQGIHHKMCKSDAQKRWEIFHEFVYYVFDSLLIPLIRSNFHVTESNVHRYRLFYFRHDVWKSISEPALNSLKMTMFEELKLHKAQDILASRSLGFSQVRLLPKEKGIRPIMNLRRRMLKKGTNVLGSSINSVLAPVHNAMNYERLQDPSRLGATLFSVGDLYSRLKEFQAGHDRTVPLYFVKLDVKSAFDTIPQAAVVELMRSLASEDEYRIAKHLEMRPGEDFRSNSLSKPVRKWASIAYAADDHDPFTEHLENDVVAGKKSAVFIDNVVSQYKSATELFHLLEEHIRNNLIKIGKKFYRQKQGIPQGSVLSSFLCNFFYADLEARRLAFLQSGESLLLRLIDDFLLITDSASHAKQFLQIMHDGVSEYGVSVNPVKTLVNFEVVVNGHNVPRSTDKKCFPYCGSFIDTETLEIRRDRKRKMDSDIRDTLTIEYAKNPGRQYHRKVLNSFKIQAHAMFLDTSLNSISTVLSNIFAAFVETADKTWTYAKCLPSGKRPGWKLVTKTIEDLAALAFVLMKNKGRQGKNAGYQCAVNKVQVEWLAMTAFRKVLSKRQSNYQKVLEWLEERISMLESKKNKQLGKRLRCAVLAAEGAVES